MRSVIMLLAVVAMTVLASNAEAGIFKCRTRCQPVCHVVKCHPVRSCISRVVTRRNCCVTYTRCGVTAVAAPAPVAAPADISPEPQQLPEPPAPPKT